MIRIRHTYPPPKVKKRDPYEQQPKLADILRAVQRKKEQEAME